jgi:phosphohistidine phosphatase SixA
VEVEALEPGKLEKGYRLLLQRYDDGASVMLVGHEPDLSDLIGSLIAGTTPARIELKKGACACLSFDASSLKSKAAADAPAATLLWLMTAQALSDVARSSR